MNEKLVFLVAIVVDPGLEIGLDEFWNEADALAEGALEFVALRADAYFGSAGAYDVIMVFSVLLLNILQALIQLSKHMLLLDDLQKLLALSKFDHILYGLIDFVLKSLDLVQYLYKVVLRRRLVLLHALHLIDLIFGIRSQLIDDIFHHHVLIIHFLIDLYL